MEVVASTVVKFGGGSDALVVFELDGYLNVDATGKEKSSFLPGEQVFVRLHHDASVRLDKMLATHGQIDDQGSGSRDISQQLLWEEQDDEHDLTCIPSGGLAVGFYGNEASGIKKSGDRVVVIGGGELPALSLVEYSAQFRLFRLIAPNVVLGADETYPVVIVAYMEEV